MLNSQEDILQLRRTLQQYQEKVQTLRVELYRRRGEAVPLLEPEKPVQSGQSDEHTKLQEALDQACNVAQVYEAELQRMTTHVIL